MFLLVLFGIPFGLSIVYRVTWYLPGTECNVVPGAEYEIRSAWLSEEWNVVNKYGSLIGYIFTWHCGMRCSGFAFYVEPVWYDFFTYVRAIRAWLSLQRGLFLSEYFGFTFRACLSRRGLMFKGFRYVVTVMFFFLLEIFFIQTSKFCFIPGTECNEVHGYLKSEMMWTNTVLWLVIFLHDIVECDGPICILY